MNVSLHVDGVKLCLDERQHIEAIHDGHIDIQQQQGDRLNLSCPLEGLLLERCENIVNAVEDFLAVRDYREALLQANVFQVHFHCLLVDILVVSIQDCGAALALCK